MSFEIIDNIEIPASIATRNRQRGEFALALDSLNVGQGFVFHSSKPLKAHYPKVSPSKFVSGPGMCKKFKLWVAGEGQIGVKRMEDIPAEECGKAGSSPTALARPWAPTSM